MKLKNLNKSTLLIILAITLMASSCASKMQTETITYLSESDRADIKKLAIYVESDEQLNVNLSTINDRIWVAMLEDSGNCDSIGCIFLPLLVGAVAIVEESVRSGMDHAKEKEFRKDLSDINLNNLLSKSIAKSFENLNSEIHAEITDTYDQKVLVRNGFDSVLHININKIEANKCPRQVVHGYINPDQAAKGIGPISSDYDDSSEDISKWNEIYPEYNQMFQKDAANNLLSAPNTIKISNEEKEKRKKVDKEISPIKPTIDEYTASDQIRIWIAFKSKITLLKDNSVLWEKQEGYYDPECESVKVMQDNPETIVVMFSRSFYSIGSNIVSEIIY